MTGEPETTESAAASASEPRGWFGRTGSGFLLGGVACIAVLGLLRIYYSSTGPGCMVPDVGTCVALLVVLIAFALVFESFCFAAGCGTVLGFAATLAALVLLPVRFDPTIDNVFHPRLPVVFEIGTWRVSAHFVYETAGYALGFQTYRILRRRAGDVVDDTARWTTIAAAAIGAAAGSKLLYLLDDPVATWAHRGDPEWLLGGKTIVGAILGGWGAVEWIKRRTGVVRRTGDLFAAPLCVGIAIGRCGCFLAGLGDHTYGLPTTLPWGINLGDGVLRHPTALYEAALFVALALPFARATLRPHREGAVFRAFLATYLAWRLGIDFLKPGPSHAGMSGIQWACAAGLVVVFVTWRPRDGAGAAADPSASASGGARG